MSCKSAGCDLHVDLRDTGGCRWLPAGLGRGGTATSFSFSPATSCSLAAGPECV